MSEYFEPATDVYFVIPAEGEGFEIHKGTVEAFRCTRDSMLNENFGEYRVKDRSGKAYYVPEDRVCEDLAHAEYVRHRETKGSETFAERLNKLPCVLVVGTPGLGKTYATKVYAAS